MDKAERRHRRERAVRHARRVMLSWWPYSSDPHDYREWVERCAPLYADNLKKCSCPRCGNPRKWFHEATIQERIARQEAP